MTVGRQRLVVSLGTAGKCHVLCPWGESSPKRGVNLMPHQEAADSRC